MMKDFKDIGDDQIRVIGKESMGRKRKHCVGVVVIAALLVVVAGILVCYLAYSPAERQEAVSAPVGAEAESGAMKSSQPHRPKLGLQAGISEKAFVEIIDTVANEVALKLYVPHHAQMTLQTGQIELHDTTIVYIARAADLRADNGGIVGAFVCKGKPLSWGLSKRGYCASIEGQVYVGVAENSPLFEAATEKEGYFFRQYPLVSNGQVVENKPKGKSVRRGICDRQGEIFMAETVDEVSFHDFSQALVELGVNQAVYIVGSDSYGWAVDKDGNRHEFGKLPQQPVPVNTTYLVWR